MERTANMMLKRLAMAAVLLAIVAGCSSTEQVGLITRPTSEPGSLLTEQRSYSALRPVEGRSCRYFLLGVIPWGDSQSALEDALEDSGGDAIINATVETSLYGFAPIYNIFSFTCTTVRGIAVKYDA